MEDVKDFIEAFILHTVQEAKTETCYRRPLVGFADAGDPRWEQLKIIAEPTHLLPEDILPGASTVVAFFLPFDESVVKANRRAKETAREWAVAYLETNALINHIAQSLIEELGKRGVRAAAQPATHNWDPVTLVSHWSHKSAAAIAGLGSFGLHRMLITDAGCAGRCGSLVIDVPVTPTSRTQPERCRFFFDESCTYCVDACPAGALRLAAPGEWNIEKQRCHQYILSMSEKWGADCCGKCAIGPCALGSSVKGT